MYVYMYLYMLVQRFCSVALYKDGFGEAYTRIVNPVENWIHVCTQYSCLEKPMDRGAWQDTVHRVAESDMTEVT